MTARWISQLAILSVAALMALPAPAQASFAGANGKIAYSRNGDLFLVDPDGTDRVRLTEGRAGDFSPVFSPDGREVAFLRHAASDRWQEVFVAATDGSSVRRVAPHLRGYADHLTWSPDGGWVAFDAWVETHRGMGGAVFVVRPDGTSLTRLTGYWPRSFQPAWSPDSARLAFARQGIVAIDVDGTDKLRLTTADTIDESPQWSPQGSRILFGRAIPGPPGQGDTGVALISIAPDGTGERMLTDGIGFDYSPRWSPGGTRIAFLDFDPNAGTDLWVMGDDGSDLRPLTTGRIAGQGFAWSPDGTRIVFDEWNDLLMVGVAGGPITHVTSTPKKLELLGDWQAVPS